MLTSSQKEHFLERGYVVFENAVPPENVREWANSAFARMGYERDNPETWEKPRVHLSPSRHVDAAQFAPRAFAATCEVVGGRERICEPYVWGDTFVANFSEGADEAYRAPSADCAGWHKDGYFFRHFLDSPEQGLLTVVAWTDMLERGGGTFIAPDSLGVVARFLAEHPQGVESNVFGELVSQCRQFEELTARAGDVVLLHPFMLHAVSQNHLRVARIISNPPLLLREPMNFQRADGNYSLVEQAILNALGVEQFDFQAKAQREGAMPQWWQNAQQEIAGNLDAKF